MTQLYDRMQRPSIGWPISGFTGSFDGQIARVATDDVPFQASAPLTLGIEEEFLLLDGVDLSVPALRAHELLDGTWRTMSSPGGWLKPELLRCSIELATAASRDLAQLDTDLRALRGELLHRAVDLDLALVALGLHPSLDVTDAMVSPTEHHRDVAALLTRTGALGEHSTHGIHVHVGAPDLDDAVRVMDALAAHVPLFIACAANSPVVNGCRSPWRSARSELLHRTHGAGSTPRFRDADDFREVYRLHLLAGAGERQRFLWDVAIVPWLGTVEVRCFDAQLDPDLTLGFATLVQGIAAHVLAGGAIHRPHSAIERHNAWSALEFGLEARFLQYGRDHLVVARDLLRETIDLVRPQARELGSEPWLDLLEAGLAQQPADGSIEAFERGGVAGLLQFARLAPTPPA